MKRLVHPVAILIAVHSYQAVTLQPVQPHIPLRSEANVIHINSLLASANLTAELTTKTPCATRRAAALFTARGTRKALPIGKEMTGVASITLRS